MNERWRVMEQFENIAICQPVYAGDLISKSDERMLQELKLVKRNAQQMSVLTWRGKLLWKLWNGAI